MIDSKSFGLGAIMAGIVVSVVDRSFIGLGVIMGGFIICGIEWIAKSGGEKND